MLTEYITARVDPMIMAALKATAAKSELPMTALIRFALRFYFGLEVPFRPEPIKEEQHA